MVYDLPLEYGGNITQPLNETESNCYIRSCQSSTLNPECDTKMFVTWIGTDVKNRPLISDGFRITNMKNFSIRTYFEEAVGISKYTQKN